MDYHNTLKPLWEWDNMRMIKLATIALLASTLFLGGCGRRGALEAPPNVEKEEQPQEEFILNPLIKPRR